MNSLHNYWLFKPEDLIMGWAGNAFTLTATLSTTHEAKAICEAIEVMAENLPSTRPMLRGDIYEVEPEKPFDQRLRDIIG